MLLTSTRKQAKRIQFQHSWLLKKLEFMVNYGINYTLSQVGATSGRDREVAPTEEVYNYFQASPYIGKRS